MNTNENILTGYCFLAALTENQDDLYNHVYLPICKRTLSLYSLNGGIHGNVSDIKALILSEYGIDVPLLVVKKLINATYKSLSNRARRKYSFNVFQNGETFEIQKYAFSDLEIQYKKGRRDAKALQEAFETYLESEKIERANLPSFANFLEKNKRHLAAFFKNTGNINGENLDTSFIHHVTFLEMIETNNHEFFEIAKGLYIGSIVASFLEAGIDLEPKFERNEVYFLDTPVILRALDLQKEEETLPIKELLDIIRTTGGRIKILSITIEEIGKVIENAIIQYNPNIPTSTINEACLRLGKNKAWLITYNGNLEKNILNTLKIEKETLPNSFIERNQSSTDVKALQKRRIRKGNALHDVLAYLYVREQRGESIVLFQKAKAWFLSSNIELLRFNRELNPNNGITEIVMPDALTGLLWLKNPTKLIEKVKSVGLSELMAMTLNEEIASKELINEFESTIKNLEGISEDDYRILLESVAHESAKKIEQFNLLAEQSTEKAKAVAQKIIERERSRRARNVREIKTAQASQKQEEVKNNKLQERLGTIEKTLAEAQTHNETAETQIEKLSERITAQDHLLKRIAKLIIVFLILLALSVIGFLCYDALSIILKVLNWIISASGLFSFLNLILNAVKFYKDR